MPQQISETSDRHRSKDGVSGIEERAERTWPQPDAMPALYQRSYVTEFIEIQRELPPDWVKHWNNRLKS